LSDEYYIRSTIIDYCDCCQDIKVLSYNEKEDTYHCDNCKTEYIDDVSGE